MASTKWLMIIGAAFMLAWSGCKVSYSFTGASVAPDVKTISIATFASNREPLAPPSLPQTFTEALKDKFLRQTNLTLVKSNGDLIMDGEVIAYRQSDEAVGGNANTVSTLSRLTITVSVKFTDTLHPENSYEKNFSAFAQFDATKTLSEVESALIDEINEKLTQDIFNATLGNW
jgi:hypothetical protein